MSILEGRRHCIWQDGAFSPMGGLASIAELIRDTTMLWRQGKHLPPNVFRTLIAQSHLRMTFRALFNVYRFRYFWDRADYNTDHIVRTQELRAVGTKSLGIMHGIASICRGMHQMRYVDYDVYFSIGRHSYEKFYKTHWPSAIDVRTIGSFGISREEHHRMARSDRENKDVAFFIVPTVQGSATLDVAAAVAAAFPDRIVYLNSKKRYLKGSYLEEIRNHCATHNNLRLHTGRSYDLMSECGYVFSDGSTLTAEAIQFGLYGFALNLIGDRWKYNIYADFPGLLLTSAEESIDVMKKIEACDLKYPRESYSELIDLSGRIFFDTARIALDLPPKEGVLPELAFSPTT